MLEQVDITDNAGIIVQLFDEKLINNVVTTDAKWQLIKKYVQLVSERSYIVKHSHMTSDVEWSHILGKTMTSKIHFEIYWPLVVSELGLLRNFFKYDFYPKVRSIEKDTKVNEKY